MQSNKIIWAMSIFFILSAVSCASNLETRKRQSAAVRKVGEVYLSQENYTAALRQLLEAEQLYSKDHLLHNALGIAYRKKGLVEKAIFHFEKAIELKPDFAPAVNNLGTVYFDQKDYDAAIACFKKVSGELLYATPYYAFYNLGKAYYEKKEYGLSEEYYMKALDSEPKFLDPLVGLGRVYIATGKISDAISALTSALKQYPQYARAYFYLGQAYTLIKDYRRAVLAYQKAIEIEPNTPLARDSNIELKKLKKYFK